MQEIKTFILVLSVLYVFKHIVTLLHKFKTEDYTSMIKSQYQEVLIYLSLAYIITSIVI